MLLICRKADQIGGVDGVFIVERGKSRYPFFYECLNPDQIAERCFSPRSGITAGHAPPFFGTINLVFGRHASMNIEAVLFGCKERYWESVPMFSGINP